VHTKLTMNEQPDPLAQYQHVRAQNHPDENENLNRNEITNKDLRLRNDMNCCLRWFLGIF